jgi:hypothetical protein
MEASCTRPCPDGERVPGAVHSVPATALPMVADSPVIANSRRASSPAPAVLHRLYMHTHMQIDQQASLLASSLRAPRRRARR